MFYIIYVVLVRSECLHLPQNSYVEFLTSKMMVLRDGAFGRWLVHEAWALIIWISTFVKETRTSQMRIQYNVTWKRALIRPWWHPDLRLWDSRTIRNKFMLFINHWVCYFVIAAQISRLRLVYIHTYVTACMLYCIYVTL